ncbi:MAG: metal-sensing transcriptional repressor [Candidatus Peregrinibacteria bacterium]|nr:metal-sensing transcriptional repressor [Candidatus Peregrinibacteria bacterium]
MHTEQKEKAYIALKKASSLLQKILKMVEGNAYCIDVMQQNLAVIGLLKSAHHSLMEGHLDSCVKTALDTGSATKKQQMIQEILKVSKLASK